jgi:hypothetical protein
MEVLRLNVAAITLVGHGFWQAPEILDQTMQVLGASPCSSKPRIKPSHVGSRAKLYKLIVNLHQQLMVGNPQT